ncbi:hypothetical protein [Haloechinothrix sp. LS1_15]|uniref:hypothetical protein n=1 Tax=Haloechinothrix sp. LS1_15 TaxID=2652248 RepID=UPI0029465844|nr:hypothetical protein [Haloechinothrix sp. LS1_15]MDV6014347.1 hypothetical protein [Haloechinothrix sp. LS1_15]
MIDEVPGYDPDHGVSTGALVLVGDPIITDVYTSDPTVLVHDGTAYLYTGDYETPPGTHDYVSVFGVAVAEHPLGSFRGAIGSALVTDDRPFDS